MPPPCRQRKVPRHATVHQAHHRASRFAAIGRPARPMPPHAAHWRSAPFGARCLELAAAQPFPSPCSRPAPPRFGPPFGPARHAIQHSSPPDPRPFFRLPRGNSGGPAAQQWPPPLSECSREGDGIPAPPCRPAASTYLPPLHRASGPCGHQPGGCRRPPAARPPIVGAAPAGHGAARRAPCSLAPTGPLHTSDPPRAPVLPRAPRTPPAASATTPAIGTSGPTAQTARTSADAPPTSLPHAQRVCIARPTAPPARPAPLRGLRRGPATCEAP
mmetsp:Transcript_50807/g.164330  ORF Transcript_50807/g.164330 Transcript_50807/m.164330 type:complete len:273 (+) Transcript_50807:820-1638(+)